MPKSNDPIKTPTILSDKWLEDKYDELEGAINTGHIAIDFSTTIWVELSSLITLTGIIIRNIRKIEKVDFLFATAWDSQSKQAVNAFHFFVNSQFFLAINEAFSDSGKQCRIMFALPSAAQKKQQQIYDDITDYLIKSTGKLDAKTALFVGTTSSNIPIIIINLDFFGTSFNIDSSFFSVFGYGHEIQKDSFILPITYIPQKNVKDYLQGSASRSFSRNLAMDFNDAKGILPEEAYDLLSSLKQLWVYELLSNAREHGGDNVLMCVRYGDWSVRDNFSSIYKQDILYEGYNHRCKYLDEKPRQRSSKFLDIHVADTGQGFVKLEGVYLKDSLIRRKSNPGLRTLHRYAMYPHSTRKEVVTEDKAPIHITGLGVIAERIISYDGLIAIKDRSTLTWFDKKTLGWVTSEGREDKSSKTDFGLTVISAILPIPDEEWARQNMVLKVPVNVDVTDTFVLLPAPPTKTAHIVNCKVFKENAKNKHTSTTLPYSDITNKFPPGTFIIIDLNNISSDFHKPAALALTNLILNLRKQGYPVILYSADIAEMKILQSIVEGERRLGDFHTDNVLKKEKLFCPILSNDFRLFLCGNLTVKERKGLSKTFFEEEKNAHIQEIILRWGQKAPGKLPFRSIERSINRDRGQLFLTDLKKKHLVQGRIKDIHGNILDSYYEVKSYLTNPYTRQRWIPDIRRMISKSGVNIVIVDGPELKALVSSIVEAYLYREIKIMRLHEGVIEVHETISPDSKALLLLSGAFSGSVLRSVPRLRDKEGIPITAVITLLDLTGRSKSEISRDIVKCDYDFFAKAQRPESLTDVETIPDYVVTRRARIVPVTALSGSKTDIFESVVSKKFLFPFLSQSQNVFVGHTVEHGHHYDVFIDVRKSIATNDKLAQTFRMLLQRQLSSKKRTIIYSEDSELAPIISLLKYGPGFQEIIWIPARQVFDDRFVWPRHSSDPDIKDSEVIVLDEGAYTCTSLVGILKLVVEKKPKCIYVIVLEKRFTQRSLSTGLKRMTDYYKKQGIDIKFFTVIDIAAPTWTQEDCPYCQIRIPPKKERPQRFDKIFIGNGTEIRDEVGLKLWFLSGLYSGAEDARVTINAISKQIFQFPRHAFMCAEMAIIHGSILDKWQILSDVQKFLKESMSVIKVSDKATLLKHSGFLPEEVRKRFFEIIFIEAVCHIDDTIIFWAAYDSISENKEWLNELKEKVRNISLSRPQVKWWKILCDYLEHGDYSGAIIDFFRTTGINREKSHEPLAVKINFYGPTNEDVKHALYHLKQLIVQRFDQSLPITQLTNIMGDPYHVASLLQDQNFIESFNKTYTVKADHMVDTITESVQSKKGEIDITNIFRNRRDGGKEVPLLSMQNDELSDLKKHLKCNIGHGECTVEYEIIENSFIIICKSAQEAFDNEIEKARTASSYNKIKDMLKPFGADILYVKIDNQFSIKITAKVVDHVKVQNNHM